MEKQLKTKIAEQISHFLGNTSRNEIVQLDALRHKIKTTKRAKHDMTRISMGRQHDKILKVLMIKIFDECQRLSTITPTNKERMNKGKRLFSELEHQITANKSEELKKTM